MNAGIRIIFLGNPLHGDDAAGVRALALSRSFRWPAGVELVDGGTGGVSLLPLFRHCRRIILVDAFLSPERAGEIRHLRQVTAASLAGAEGLEHGGGIRGLLALVPLLVSPAPVIELFAIGGRCFTPCTPELSDEVAHALPALCRRLHRYVSEESVVTGSRVRITGCVQGVGFRPFVYRLATELGLTGEVGNIGAGVEIRLAADKATLAQFCRRLRAECPAHARIESMTTEPCDVASVSPGFTVSDSQAEGQGARFPPDLAVCPQCLAELTDPQDRRHGYPFINCTDCGPRYSIVKALPWDRVNTAMADFPFCAACRKEYGDPASRRFHAEPVACVRCGPHIWLQSGNGEVLQGSTADLLAQCRGWLQQDRVLALKGIGGFQLVCDAGSAKAIALLRRRKHRPAKPFAVMLRDLAQAETCFALNDMERKQLNSPAAPIVLLPKVRLRQPVHGLLPEALAPGMACLGVMLASSPLHWLLLNEVGGPLLMTSGNAGGEPICTGNRQALSVLALLADDFLLHNRAIVHRCDDSVQALVAGRPRLVRRARGYVPDPIALPAGLEGSVLALGADLKNSFCITGNGRAVLSAHIGDLNSLACLDALQQQVDCLPELLGLEPRAIAVDLHPDYAATRLGERLARQQGLPLFRVQHHHAHLVSCLVENGHPPEQPVLGIVLDGLGYGDDGSLWGGEFLLADYAGYRRLARLRPFPLLGGDKASRQPWRNLLAQLAQMQQLPPWPTLAAEHAALDWLIKPEAQVLLKMAPRFPLTSSAGRLFDAVAALLGVAPPELSFEGEAAMLLEALAEGAQASACYDFTLSHEEKLWQLDPAPLWPALLKALRAGEHRAVLAANFHLSLVKGLCQMVARLRRQRGVNVTTVALSGGVMQNRLVLEPLSTELEATGLTVLSQSRAPSNDGGIALGQAAIALAQGVSER
ncbi:carbamoyltransferase HypF [Oceanimonas marisflavi]|uniref:carbamoyltransferase HypF n=1 Tax=Oceanimonas marisflavi TaxID=2059724 RepID=UPI001E2D195A|nr:carbamoyltransferase HypF [Oceanimonas marisflavi]